jgi:hypothetical protein
MAEKDENLNPKEEYKIDEEHAEEVYQVGPEELSKPKGSKLPKFTLPTSKLKNKKLFILLAIILFVSLVYKLIPSSEKKPEQVAETSMPVSSTNSQLGELNQKYENNSAAITQIQSKLAETQNNLNDLSSAVYNINMAIQKISGDISQILAEKNAAKTTKKAKKIIKTPYHVTAIVPGRAWLEHKDGSVVTVRLGNKLGKYGTILNINPNKGIVGTSSGAIIRYGTNDV